MVYVGRVISATLRIDGFFLFIIVVGAALGLIGIVFLIGASRTGLRGLGTRFGPAGYNGSRGLGFCDPVLREIRNPCFIPNTPSAAGAGGDWEQAKKDFHAGLTALSAMQIRQLWPQRTQAEEQSEDSAADVAQIVSDVERREFDGKEDQN
ncbi:hypothetical protein B0H13DRAFT_2302212 [Mycena leptocephala]|nr:hypothetical protein B0H13DRAFT_2302212 [Mycena leptocephala]